MTTSDSDNNFSSSGETSVVIPSTLPPLPEDFADNPDYGPEAIFVPDERRFLPWLAALSSQRIPYRVAYEDNQQFILVPRPQAGKAWAELTLYERVNAAWPHPSHNLAVKPRPLLTDWGFFSTIIAGSIWARFHYLVHGLDQQRWFELGRNDATLFFQGQWWRVITALTLHSNAAHLVSNLVWGVALGMLITSDLGVGAGFLAMLLSGIIGNLLSVSLASAGYRSLGASTMVFGMLGIICAISTWDNWQRNRAMGKGRLMRLIPWLPLLAGSAMFSIYGTAPGTDLLGHAFGFLAGIGIGILQPGCRKVFARKVVQITLALIAAAVVGLAWKAALTHN